MIYKRVLLKLSGESLSGSENYGITQNALEHYSIEISEIVKKGIQTAVVLGGGNIFRGVQGTNTGVDRVQGDYMGMLATIINALAMQASLRKAGIETTVLSGIPIEPVCEKMSAQKADKLLNDGHVVIVAGGTGNPFFTTDSAAALRAIEIKADIILKGTRVDGVFDKDPEKYSDAVKFDSITFADAYKKNLRIMDLTAFTLCQENNMPIIVFNINKQGILSRILIDGKKEGTIVTNMTA